MANKPTKTPKPRSKTTTARPDPIAASQTPATTAIRPRRPTAFIASAARIRLSEKPQSRRTEQWQDEAWAAFENVGEIQHGVEFLANAISKVKLFGAHVPEDPRLPPTRDSDPRAEAAILALRSRITGTYSAIMREAAINLFVPGEGYLIGIGSSTVNEDVEGWEFRSVDEVQITDGVLKLRDFPSGPFTEYKDNQVVIIRIHLPHPRWSYLPLSPLRGILASAEEIQRIERVIRAAARSRAAGPGLLLIPEEVSFGATDITTESSTDTTDPFFTELLSAMMTPIQDEGSAAAVVPMLVRGPGDVLDKIRKVSLAIDIDVELIKLERAIIRLAQGLPLPPEVVTGKAGLSHWSAFSVDEAVVTAYVEPFTLPIVDALTLEYYRPYLIAAGMSEAEAESRMLWYDVTPLITRPNRSADADYGLEHIALSDSAWRRIKGFDEEDAPSPIEKLSRLILQRGSFDPIFTAVILKELGIAPDDMELPAQTINQPPSTQPGDAPPASTPGPPDASRPKSLAPRSARGPGMNAAVVSSVTEHLTSRSLVLLPSSFIDPDSISLELASLDRDLSTRLQSQADAAVSRALEKASSTVISKLRSHKRFAPMLKDIPKLECAARVGRPALEAEGIHLSTLFDGAFDQFTSRFIDWTRRTYSKTARVLSIPISPPDEAIEAAAQTLRAQLITFTVDRLINPTSPADPELFGELDETITVPRAFITAALRQAGGSDPTSTLPSPSSPPTSIASGYNVLCALLNAGWSIEGFEWCYPATVRTRDFEPHANLDGVRFTTFYDPVLANRGTWPPVAFHYPGDHSACSCSIRPLLIPPSTPISSPTEATH